MSASPAPAHLGDEGTRVWNLIASEYTFRPDELVTLEDYCAMADELVDLGEALADLGSPYMTKGSMGQEVEHPIRKMRRDLRMKRATLGRQLNLRDLTDGVDQVNQQRAAAQSRWAAAHGSSA